MGRSRVTYEIDLAGAAGAAVGSVDHYQGQPAALSAVVLQYNGGQPATIDVTVTNEGRAIAARPNANTNGVIYPRHLTQDETGVATTTREAPIVLGQITIAVAQGNAATRGVVATLIFDT